MPVSQSSDSDPIRIHSYEESQHAGAWSYNYERKRVTRECRWRAQSGLSHSHDHRSFQLPPVQAHHLRDQRQLRVYLWIMNSSIVYHDAVLLNCGEQQRDPSVMCLANRTHGRMKTDDELCAMCFDSRMLEAFEAFLVSSGTAASTAGVYRSVRSLAAPVQHHGSWQLCRLECAEGRPGPGLAGGWVEGGHGAERGPRARLEYTVQQAAIGRLEQYFRANEDPEVRKSSTANFRSSLVLIMS